jgi:hypothetical protein
MPPPSSAQDHHPLLGASLRGQAISAKAPVHVSFRCPAQVDTDVLYGVERAIEQKE